jgi:hypothetical protein
VAAGQPVRARVVAVDAVVVVVVAGVVIYLHKWCRLRDR